MAFTIFDTETGNAVDSFSDEHEAFDVIRTAVATYGSDVAALWILVVYDPISGRREIAEGDALVHLACAVAA